MPYRNDPTPLYLPSLPQLADIKLVPVETLLTHARVTATNSFLIMTICSYRPEMVSHADSTLGLGIVTHADDRRVTLHFPAVEERVYATIVRTDQTAT